MWDLVRDFYRFSREHKKTWMIPVMILLLGTTLLLVAANSSAVAPFIYALF